MLKNCVYDVNVDSGKHFVKKYAFSAERKEQQETLGIDLGYLFTFII